MEVLLFPIFFFFLFTVAFASETQAAIFNALYDAALTEENSQELYQLLTLYPSFVDPFSNGSATELMYIACRCDDMKLLGYLLDHDQYHTIADDSFTVVKETRSGMALLELLKDGRMDVDDLCSLKWYNDFALKWALRGLDPQLLKACWIGDHKAIKKMVFTGLRFEKFDVLLGRSKNHGKVLRAIRGEFLRSLDLPPNDTNLQRFMILSSVRMATGEIVPYIKLRHELQPILGHHLVPEVIDIITLYAVAKSVEKPAFELLPSFCLSAWLFVLYQTFSTVSEISGSISLLILALGVIAFVRHFALNHYHQVQQMRKPLLVHGFDTASGTFFVYKIFASVYGSKMGSVQLDWSSVLLQYIILFIAALYFMETRVK